MGSVLVGSSTWSLTAGSVVLIATTPDDGRAFLRAFPRLRFDLIVGVRSPVEDIDRLTVWLAYATTAAQADVAYPGVLAALTRSAAKVARPAPVVS